MIYIALLKGINVGGHKKIKMTTLAKMFTALGYNNVSTYIQSGNVVFRYKKISVDNLSKAISKKIKETFDFDIDVIVKIKVELEFVFNNNPFIKEEIEKLHVTFLSSLPKEININLGIYEEAAYKIIDDVVYLYFKIKISNSKLLNNLNEKKLQVNIATTRNWKTVTQLVQIANKTL